MTIRDVGTGLIYLGALAAAITATIALVNALLIRPLRNWVHEQITDEVAKGHDEIRQAIDAHEVKHHQHRRRQM